MLQAAVVANLATIEAAHAANHGELRTQNTASRLGMIVSMNLDSANR